MKSRKIWFLIFYCILLLFLTYSLIYLIIIWNNHDLFGLFGYKFKVITLQNKVNFHAASFPILFILPTIGFALTISGFIAMLFSQTIWFEKVSLTWYFAWMISSFLILMIGFFLSFVSQLFYNQWDNSAVIIMIGNNSKAAISYYKNWLNINQLWGSFGLFFGFFVICILLIIKLHFLNYQWLNYVKRTDQQTLIIKKHLFKKSDNYQFHPNYNKTITISLDENKKNKNSKKKTNKK